MYRFNQTFRKWGAAALLVTLTFPAISWNDSLIHSNGLQADMYVSDTLPGGSLEDHINKLEKAREKLDGKLAEKDWSRAEKEIESALAKINSAEIEKQIQQALAALQDNKKLMQSELKNMDVEMQQVQQHLQDVKKEIEMSRVQLQKDLKTKMPDIKKELEKAKISMDEAKRELEAYREMITEMEREGLLPDKNNYRIEYRDEKLSINGKEQPKEVADRYRKYFKKKQMVISNENNHFNAQSEE